MRRIILFILVCIMLSTGGCGGSGNDRYVTQDRMSHGLVIILPGIEGVSRLNKDIRKGLLDSGVYRAITIYSWGRPVPLAGMLLNQVDFVGNRLEGIRIARIIQSYKRNYPGRPVHIIGHSGGGGVAVFSAEAMPEDSKIDGLILLSASISSAYDLTKALKHCRNGILNIYTTSDIGLLVVGTMLAGNVDGTRGPAAGAIGFDKPGKHAGAEKKLAYQKLYQMRLIGEDGEGVANAHTTTAHPDFISLHVAPWVLADSWPITSGYLLAQE